MKPWNRFFLPTLLAFALPAALLAQSSGDSARGTDLAIGTWVLNVAKSTFNPGPAPQSETRTYEITPEGMHHLTVHQIAADGTAINETSTYKLDGKPYNFTGSSQIDSVAPTRHSANEIRVTESRQGKIIGHYTRVVSKGGRTMTATNTFRRLDGKTEHDVQVYDRQ